MMEWASRWTAHLSDMRAEGRAYPSISGVARVRHRRSRGITQPLRRVGSALI